MPNDKWNRLEMTSGYLRELSRERTQPEMAVMLGVSEMTIRRWMQKHGVEALSEYERRIQDTTGPTLKDLTATTLRFLYEERLLTDAEIGARYGVAKTPIRLRRLEHGIEAISKAERRARRAKESPPPAPTPVTRKPEIATAAAVAKPKPLVVCAWKRCHKKFLSERGARYCSTECDKAVDADRARKRRKLLRTLGPIRRTFICQNSECGVSWETDEPGNWRLCVDCRAVEEQRKLEIANVRRAKHCAYAPCGQSFVDESPKNTRKFCSEDCLGRSKRIRAGVVSEDGEFLAEQVRICEKCSRSFTPKKSNQRFCSEMCRLDLRAQNAETRRHKTCVHCKLAFTDTSSKNNMRAHPECSRLQWGHVSDSSRQPSTSDRTEARRRHYLLSGLHGRIDDIRTLSKFTNTWWGRVSELIFATYRSDPKDMNLHHGNRSPYDYEDAEFGRVNVRGGRTSTSPQGRQMWWFSSVGLKESCDHAFLVGYSSDRTSIEHLWLVPVSHLPASGIRMAPGSQEYVGAQWEVSQAWGLEKANTLLKELRDLPEPVRSADRFAWMDDATNLNDHAPGHKGRKGEMLYQQLHPDSRDVNREQGSTAPWDFVDADGTKVNVKTSRRNRKPESGLFRWSFGRGVLEKEHRCDVYACLCLDGDNVTALREYRIPVPVWGDRRTIHIYENDGQWAVYKRSP